MTESQYTKEYVNLERKGYEYLEIKRKMIETARRNEISGKEISIKNEVGKIIRCKKFCNNCNRELDDLDYYCGITGNVCTLWYKCQCGKYNRFVE